MSTRYGFEVYAGDPHRSESIMHYLNQPMGLSPKVERLLRSLWSGERKLAGCGVDDLSGAEQLSADALSWQRVLGEIADARIALVHQLVPVKDHALQPTKLTDAEQQSLFQSCDAAYQTALGASERMQTLIEYFRTYRRTHGLDLPDTDF